MTKHTVTLTDDELRVIRLALINWDGWDHILRTTVSDEFDIVTRTLRSRLTDVAAR